MLCRVVLRQIGLRYTKAYEVVQIINIVSMIVISMTFMMYLTYNAFLCEENHPLLRYLGIVILLHTFLVTIKNFKCIETISRHMGYRKLFNV